MSETSTETAPTEGETSTESTYTPPATQADLDRIVAERVNRTKAQFKDYNDLKTKAAEFDKLAEAQKTEAQKQADEAARWQTEAETWRGAAVASTVRALAATDFADADDAVRNLDVTKYLDAGGVIDEAGIKADLAALLETKPHYRRPDGAAAPRGVPAPNLAQGASNGSASTSDPAQQFASILRGSLK